MRLPISLAPADILAESALGIALQTGCTELGDSVRVLRRLGFQGTFDELVGKARQEIEATKRRRSKGGWSLFG